MSEVKPKTIAAYVKYKYIAVRSLGALSCVLAPLHTSDSSFQFQSTLHAKQLRPATWERVRFVYQGVKMMMKVTVMSQHHRSVSISERAASLLLVAVMMALLSLVTFEVASAGSNVCTVVQEDAWLQTTQPGDFSSATAPNCRYGAAASQAGAAQLAAMKIGWLVTFSGGPPSWLPDRVAHAPMIRLSQNRDANGGRLPSYRASPALTDNGLGRLVRDNPGKIWIIGNEVDREIYQDDLMPEVYATAYHDIYQFIKQRDPTAKVATSALVLVSPGRLQYLDRVMTAYRQQYGGSMPVDVWTFHAYAFPERYDDENATPNNAGVANGTNPAIAYKYPYHLPPRPLEERLALCERDDYLCAYEHDQPDLFVEQVVNMRTWMKANGYQNTPLLLTEWSLLHPYIVAADGQCLGAFDEYGNCFTPQRVIAYMEATVRYLEDRAIDPALGYPADNFRLVQQWAWFPLDNLGGNYTGSNPSILITPGTSTLNQMGQKYRDLIAGTSTQPNLVIDRVFADLVDSDAQSGVATAKLRVSIRNNGNAQTSAPFRVKFFRDSGLTQEIGQATVSAGLDGCAVNDVVVEVQWQGLSRGIHRYWVSVDSDGVYGSSKTGSSLVIVDPKRIFLPTVQR